MGARPWVLCALAACGSAEPATREELGDLLFHDPALSDPAGQACADCHAEATAFSDPEDDRSSAGAIRDRVGVRNAPTAMYAAFIPPLQRIDGRFAGGLFWDGRAPTLETQAAGPLLDPLEMNNASKHGVAEKLRRDHGPAFRRVFGAHALDDDDTAFAHLTEALAAYERTPRFAPFSSKYDRFMAGLIRLDDAERRGLALFEDPTRANCIGCHPPPLFTNYGYVNVGLPRWDNSMFYVLPRELNPDGRDHVDHGLMETVRDARLDGMFRVPTLRNVARTSPYGHNGYFRGLREIIEFLSARDVRCTTGSPRHCPQAEVPTTIDRVHTGSVGLLDTEIDDLVAFLGTLSDDTTRDR